MLTPTQLPCYSSRKLLQDPSVWGTIPNDEACEASGTNALDITTTARSALSSFQGNLRIDIGSTSC
ncbi:hypothetical protein B0H17DRAFT_1215880 [Mycena rosella]|uniref:Uncharacterized protein n=1 Tax=Mycena rosella TaxID=1033263 RepID=A0AAD7CD21_MYCRO|nr:hypothetical protein B0H17DRAFT_1215880 [Mycena rosella]